MAHCACRIRPAPFHRFETCGEDIGRRLPGTLSRDHEVI